MKLLPLLVFALVPACADQTAEEQSVKNAISRPVQGIVVLGALEGQWFHECDVSAPDRCKIELTDPGCNLVVSGEAGGIFTRFLESQELASEGAEALKVSGHATRIDGEGFGHMSMATCQIELERIESIKLTEHPFAPPPP